MQSSLGRLVGGVALVRLGGAAAGRVQLLLEVVELRRVVWVRCGGHREPLPLEAGVGPAHGRGEGLSRAHPDVGSHAALDAAEVRAGTAHGVGAGAAEGVGHLGGRVEAGRVVWHTHHAGRAHHSSHASFHLHAARAREVLHTFTAVHLHWIRNSL